MSAALKVADDKGLFNFSITNVSRAMGNTSKATIKHYFTHDQLRTAVIVTALERREIRIIAQAITAEHEAVAHLTDEQRREFLSHV